MKLSVVFVTVMCLLEEIISRNNGFAATSMLCCIAPRVRVRIIIYNVCSGKSWNLIP